MAPLLIGRAVYGTQQEPEKTAKGAKVLGLVNPGQMSGRPEGLVRRLHARDFRTIVDIRLAGRSQAPCENSSEKLVQCMRGLQEATPPMRCSVHD